MLSVLIVWISIKNNPQNIESYSQNVDSLKEFVD